MNNGRLKVAIIGPGHIGTDLMFKILRSSKAEAGIDGWHHSRLRGTGEGCRTLGIPTTAEGIGPILKHEGVRLSLRLHRRESPLRQCAPLLRGRQDRHRSHARRRRALRGSGGQHGRERSTPRHQPGHLRRAGDDPDRRRRRAGAGGTRRSSPRSLRGAPARAPARTSTSSRTPPRAAIEGVGGARRGQGPHHPEPGRAADHDAEHHLL